MAKVVSPVWSSIRGSICGTTYLTTPAGQIIARQRTRPAQPYTENQSMIRQALAEAASMWEHVIAGYPLLLQGWQDYAAFHSMDARECFCALYSMQRYNQLRGATVLDPYTDPPSWYSTPVITAANTPYHGGLGSTGVTLQVEIVGQAPLVDTSIVMARISPGFPLSRLRYNGPWNTKQTLWATVIGDGKIELNFSGLVEGNRYFMTLDGYCRTTTVGPVMTFARMVTGVCTNDVAQTAE